MSIQRIKAIILQELFITRHSLEVIIDLFYFSAVAVVAYGFVSTQMVGSINSPVALYLLLGTMLWEIVRVTQYSISVGSLWNIWSRNLSNMFVAPLSFKEYLVAEITSGVIKALLSLTLISVLASLLFHFNLFSLGITNLLLDFINLTIFAWSVGIIILGLIFRYGTRIQAFAWGLIFLFQPLTAAFFPVSILPKFIQTIAYFLPATYVFEAARANLTDQSVNWQAAGMAFLLNGIYLAAALIYFNLMFKKSRETGQFVNKSRYILESW